MDARAWRKRQGCVAGRKGKRWLAVGPWEKRRSETPLERLAHRQDRDCHRRCHRHYKHRKRSTKFQAVNMAEEIGLVKRRNKRSTAGNRMKALMAGVFEAEEAFMEVENDKDFVGKDAQDLFDDDFEETDEDEAYDDTEAGERELQKEEREIRLAARKKLNKSSTLPRVRLKLSPNKSGGVSPKKRPRVAMGAAVDAETAEFATRSSQRQATVKHSQRTKARLIESSQRQSLHRKRPKSGTPVKTQDVLIREALELEERNVASLTNLLNKEEEKKRQARVVRTRIEAPVVRWISRIEKSAEQPLEPDVVGPRVPDGRGRGSPSVILSRAGLQDDRPPFISNASRQEPLLGGQLKAQVATPSPSLARDRVDNPLPSSISKNQSLQDGHGFPPLHRDTPVLPHTVAGMPRTTERESRGGLMRNYLVLEVARGSDRNRYKMSETEAFLDGRKEWSHHATEEQEKIRARAQLLEDPVCAVTGLTAKYLEPTSGIPYANIRGYQVLSKVLRHEYIWAQGMGCYTNDANDEGAKGVPPEWSWVNQKGGKMRPPAQQGPMSHTSALSTQSSSQS